MAEIAEMIKMKLERNKKLKAIKQPWQNHWQLVGEYIHTRKQEFNTEHVQGEFLTREIFDGTGPKSAKVASSTLLSMLWPPTVKRLKFEPPRDLEETQEVKEYYEFVTDTVLEVMDNPKGGLPTALDEYMLDTITFGTAGLEAIPDKELGVRYKAWGVKHMTIAEGKNDQVNTIYIELERTVQELVDEYGLENVSSKARQFFADQKLNEKIKILIAIEPRLLRDLDKMGNRDMPFESMHIEIEEEHLLKESGFPELPIAVNRFWKILKETYGRSPAMDALPDVLELNAVNEATTIAIEKTLDPPLGVLDDGKLGGGEIDTSAGAVTVFNISGRAGEANPVFPLFTVGEISQAVQLGESLKEVIGDHFFVDRLLDFNNETRMTATETRIRDRSRNATLNSVFVRQISETFDPTTIRTFNILLAQGRLGVIAGSRDEQFQREFAGKEPVIIPAAIAERMVAGEDVFKLKYLTPAFRIMQAEEAEGIVQAWEFAANLAPIVPTIMDNLDEDESIQRFTRMVGAATEIIRAKTKIEEIREKRAAAIQAQQQQEQITAAAEAMRNAGQSNLIPTQGAA